MVREKPRTEAKETAHTTECAEGPCTELKPTRAEHLNKTAEDAGYSRSPSTVKVRRRA